MEEYNKYGDCSVGVMAIMSVFEWFLLITSIVFAFKEQFIKAGFFLLILLVITIAEEITKLRRAIWRFLDNKET